MATQDPYAETPESALERRNLLLKNTPATVIRKAWFALSHLLLDEGAKVVDMGCGDGAMTYAMAAMAPKLRFIGLDKSKRQINRAKETFQLHNLEFKIGDAASELFEPESIDAIINSYILHEIYSASRYNERIVGDTLRRQFNVLKKGGLMFIQKYLSPPRGEFVLLELPDMPGAGNDPATMADADLLILYSQMARPKQDPGCSGFFLEELPARFPKTRLFRLPHKWAYEFLIRKDDRAHWETLLSVEYTFFTASEFIRELRAQGARVQYSGPYWDDDLIDRKAERPIRFYRDDGSLMPPPPTCFVTLACKVGERKSLNIEERHPGAAESALKITAMRDNKTGKLIDVVSRNMDASEIIPYRIDEEYQLKIYLHDGVAKSLTGAVPRSGGNIDGRQWSGHMVEPVAVKTAEITAIGTLDQKTTALFCRDHLGLKPYDGSILERGPEYYPSPDYIDERIQTLYLKVEKARGAITPRGVLGQDDRFQARGTLREFDAQQVLNAITVGLIPSSRLELQLLSLFQRLNLRAENWTDKKIKFEAGEISASKSLRSILDSQGMDAQRFREVRGSAGQLRAVHSTFVEEGQARGAITGLAAQDVDFVIFDDQTINTAVVLPLAADLKNDIHAGFLFDQMPVPERREGNGMTASAMTFNLPASVTDINMAKKFIAEKFSVTPEMVMKMGECYYSHVGVTPQRIYPFAVALPAKFLKDPGMTFMPLYQIMMIWQSLSRSHRTEGNDKDRKKVKFVMDSNLMAGLARTYRALHGGVSPDVKLAAQSILKERFTYQGPDWSIPMTYNEAPGIPPREFEPTLESSTSSPAARREPDTLAPVALPQTTTQTAKPGPIEAAASSPTAAPAQQLAKTAASQSATLPNLIADFEDELKSLVDNLESIEEEKPSPNKW